LARRALRWGLE